MNAKFLAPAWMFDVHLLVWPLNSGNFTSWRIKSITGPFIRAHAVNGEHELRKCKNWEQRFGPCSNPSPNYLHVKSWNHSLISHKYVKNKVNVKLSAPARMPIVHLFIRPPKLSLITIMYSVFALNSSFTLAAIHKNKYQSDTLIVWSFQIGFTMPHQQWSSDMYSNVPGWDSNPQSRFNICICDHLTPGFDVACLLVCASASMMHIP